MLPINLIYDFQLLQRGVPIYCNNQLVKAIAPMVYEYPLGKQWWLVMTTQEIVYANSDKILSLNPIENVKYQDIRWN